MVIKKVCTRSHSLLQSIGQQQHLLGSLNIPQCCCLRGFAEGKLPPKKDKETCKAVHVEKAPYFKKPHPCKTDKELTTERTLGVYMRCKPPYKPECMDPCYNLSTLDQRLYKPSKSLDRKFQKYWVDCVIERKPKRCSGKRTPPEIDRRTSPRSPRCGGAAAAAGPTKKCRTMKPMKCRPLTPESPTAENRCIKFPLCECPSSRKNPKCQQKPKTSTTCRRPMTRYPSYSECRSLPVNDEPITECPKRISICEMWRVFRKRHGIN